MIGHHNVIKIILLSRNVLLSHSWTALIFRCVVIAPTATPGEKGGRVNTTVFIIIMPIMVIVVMGRMVIASLAFKSCRTLDTGPVSI